MTQRLPHSLLTLSPVIGLIFWTPTSKLSQAYQGGAINLTGLRTEYKENPPGIGERKPRFSWRLQGGGRGLMQAAYHIRVAKTPADLQAGTNLARDSGKVNSEESLHHEYAGAALQSGHRYYWQARVLGADGRDSGWSDAAYFEIGLLDAADWKASWIEPDLPEDTKKSNSAPMLRREFKLNGAIDRARAYITSHGLYETYLNGGRVGDQVFTPGWTSYNKQLQYQTYDVTGMLKSGDNAIGVMLGDGWYRGNLAWNDKRNIYGDKLGLLLQIEVTYKDGRKELVNSDQTWKASTGPVLMSEIYHGETYDTRLEKPGWTNPGFSDGEWAGVKIANHSKTILTAPAGPPVCKIEDIKPVKILKTPAGETVVDFGQNLVGWVRLKVQGAAGTTVTIRHAEVLDKAGNFYTENMRAAKTTLRYTLKGGGPEIYEPHFTFLGYRYVSVEGWPEELTTDSLTSVVVYSDMARTSEFETSNALINQLQHNILWGQSGNFLDVPTDCPQRDERLGWTGDAQVFAHTAAFNMDVAGFFTKWLRDVAFDQYDSGSVPFVIPDVLGTNQAPAGGSAAWADCVTIIPWTMYQSYGDKRFLEDQYPSMVKWVEYQKKTRGR
jgi:alpha-L-rhamnosidase